MSNLCTLQIILPFEVIGSLLTYIPCKCLSMIHPLFHASCCTAGTPPVTWCRPGRVVPASTCWLCVTVPSWGEIRSTTYTRAGAVNCWLAVRQRTVRVRCCESKKWYKQHHALEWWYFTAVVLYCNNYLKCNNSREFVQSYTLLPC